LNQADVAPAPIDSRTEPGRLDYLVFHYGGIGDLCLLSHLIASLKSASSASVGLICRSAVAGVTNLYPVKPDQVLGFDFDPAGWSSPDASLQRALWPIIEQLTHIEVDTLFCADMNLSWLGWLAAAVLRPRRAIAASPRPRPDEMISPLLKS